MYFHEYHAATLYYHKGKVEGISERNVDNMYM